VDSTGVRFPARFDPDTWEKDLERSTPAGRTAAEAAYERSGVPREHLRPCDPEGRDGNQLVNCVKVYIPHPDGKWGFVFKAIEVDGRLRLEFLSFGVRHHPKDRSGRIGSHAPNVYDFAGERVAELTARDLRGKGPDTPGGIKDPPTQDAPEG
jgi:hypothetical protein